MASDVAAWIGIGLAAGSLLVAIRAEIRASNAKGYSRRSAEAQERMAGAAEQQLVAATLPASLRVRVPTITWTLERLSKSQFRLRNTGRESASGVKVTGELEGIMTRHLPTNVEIGPMRSVEFSLHTSWGRDLPGELLVQWSGQEQPTPVPVPHLT